jgi:hypothetical protein
MSFIDIREGFSYNAPKIQFILAWSICKWFSMEMEVDGPRNMNRRQR